MDGLMLLFVGMGVLLWALAPRNSGGDVGVDSGLEAFLADGDLEPDLPWIGPGASNLDGLNGQEADDSEAPEFEDYLTAPPEDPANDWWWREIEEGPLAHVAELEPPRDDDVHINAATGLAIFTGGPAGIDTDGNASGCAPTDDLLHSDIDMSLGDTGWSDDSAVSFGSDDWS